MKNITTREQEILQHLCSGLSTKEIACELFLLYHTVESHRKSLNEKLHVRSAVQLGVFAERFGLLKRQEEVSYV